MLGSIFTGVFAGIASLGVVVGIIGVIVCIRQKKLEEMDTFLELILGASFISIFFWYGCINSVQTSAAEIVSNSDLGELIEILEDDEYYVFAIPVDKTAVCYGEEDNVEIKTSCKQMGRRTFYLSEEKEVAILELE